MPDPNNPDVKGITGNPLVKFGQAAGDAQRYAAQTGDRVSKKVTGGANSLRNKAKHLLGLRKGGVVQGRVGRHTMPTSARGPRQPIPGGPNQPMPPNMVPGMMPPGMPPGKK